MFDFSSLFDPLFLFPFIKTVVVTRDEVEETTERTSLSF